MSRDVKRKSDPKQRPITSHTDLQFGDWFMLGGWVHVYCMYLNPGIMRFARILPSPWPQEIIPTQLRQGRRETLDLWGCAVNELIEKGFEFHACDTPSVDSGARIEITMRKI